ncbi:unnamed protein product, partial [marine sediment metagenome]
MAHPITRKTAATFAVILTGCQNVNGYSKKMVDKIA